jgi:predicted transposase/invertase (TIGR01784 family)
VSTTARAVVAERQAYEHYLDDLHYQASMVQSSYGIGIIEGRKEGREEGREEGRAEDRGIMAKALKDEGVELGTIAKVSGLSVEEINRL